jgi:hypothetical protein
MEKAASAWWRALHVLALAVAAVRAQHRSEHAFLKDVKDELIFEEPDILALVAMAKSPGLMDNVLDHPVSSGWFPSPRALATIMKKRDKGSHEIKT